MAKRLFPLVPVILASTPSPRFPGPPFFTPAAFLATKERQKPLKMQALVTFNERVSCSVEWEGRRGSNVSSTREQQKQQIP